MAADLFETYAVTAVAVMLLGTLAGLTDARLYLYPLAIGGVSAISSVIGTFFARLGKGENAVINALKPLGIRHIDLPLTAPAVWRAMHGPEVNQ